MNLEPGSSSARKLAISATAIECSIPSCLRRNEIGRLARSLLLVRKPQINTKRGIYKALDSFDFVYLVQSLDFTRLEVNGPEVLFNTGWCDRLG
jgi:hypothetical protein